MDGDHHDHHIADTRQGYMPKSIPGTGAVDFSGFIIAFGNCLHGCQKGNTIKRNISPKMQHHNKRQGNLRIAQPVTV